jgi:hypothetical protein
MAGRPLSFADFRGQQIADDALRLVLALDGRGDDFIERGLHAVQFQIAHRSQNLGTFHHTALLRLS